TTMCTHLDAHAPCEQHVRGLPGKTLLTFSWIHLLKGWSLLKTRGDSVLQWEMTLEKIEARRRAAQTIRLDAMQKLVAEEENGCLEQAMRQSQNKIK
ncbi:MAG: hypothetical protein QE265_04540, partial [Rhodoferax sp.]|nr:hypothetical protein [Rhodoferax sp.]